MRIVVSRLDNSLESFREKIKRLRRRIKYLVGPGAFVAKWAEAEPSQIVSLLTDAQMGLDPDLVHMRLANPTGEAALEVLWIGETRELCGELQETGAPFNLEFGDVLEKWPVAQRNRFGDRHVSIASVGLWLWGFLDLIGVGFGRMRLPEQEETILSAVAARQEAVGLPRAAPVEACVADGLGTEGHMTNWRAVCGKQIAMRRSRRMEAG